MSSDKDWRKYYHPRLAEALERGGASQALMVADLEQGNVLEIETANHRYFLTVLDPETRRVRVMSDGPHLIEPTEMFVAGALLIPGGSMIMVGRVAIGHSIEFTLPGLRRLVTTPVKSIAVNGIRIFPLGDDEDFSMVN